MKLENHLTSFALRLTLLRIHSIMENSFGRPKRLCAIKKKLIFVIIKRAREEKHRKAIMNENFCEWLLFINLFYIRDQQRSHVSLVSDQLNCVAELLNASANLKLLEFQANMKIYFNRQYCLCINARANTSRLFVRWGNWGQHLLLVFWWEDENFTRNFSDG